jgi:hypothetical protein
MSKTTQEKLLDEFTAIGGRETDGLSAILGSPLDPPASLGAIAAQGGITESATASNGPATSGGGITASSVVETVLGSGLGLVPLIGGLIGLFSGGVSNAPAPLVKYAMPASIDFETAETDGGLTGASYDQMGMPRAYSGGSASQSSTGAGGYGGGGPSGTGGLPAQITVNVQAMDSQSFMDHSADIAAAVRNAMLNLNSINDVVNDL